MANYFTRDEFKCPHCGENNISDEFIDRLDEVRHAYGKPMVVLSGYRCPAHNASVGGVDGSAHTEGIAADIACSFARDRLALVESAINNGFGRIGIAKSFIHLDISETHPQS